MNTGKVKLLNDALRKDNLGGKIMLTASVSEREDRNEIIQAVRQFDNFCEANDPRGEHDFGEVRVNNGIYFWKIDYYDLNYEFHSPNKSDSKVTRRVLTIMERGEY
jgi:hypothetical protein